MAIDAALLAKLNLYPSTMPTQSLGDLIQSVVDGLAPGAIAQTITNGVTTSAPSQDVVFDALALKVPTAFVAGDATKWTGAVSPATVQLALDQLASRVEALETP